MHYSKAKIFPLKLLIFNLVFTFIASLIMIYFTLESHQNKNDFIKRDIKINEFIWEIIYFDEALTMSAYLYAETGDKSWKQRYFAFEQQLNETLNKIKKSLNSNKDRLGFIYQTITANNVLVSLEKQSFELVDSNKTEEARKILNSNQYMLNKQKYLRSIQQLKIQEKDNLQDKAKFLNIISIFNVILIISLVLSVSILWIILTKRIKNWFLQIEEANKSLSESKHAIEKSNEKLSKFVYVCSHDMKEPVRNIFNLVELIEKDNTETANPKQIEYFKFLKESSQKIYNLIDSLLQHSKHNSDDLESMYSKFCLNSLVKDIISYESSFNKNIIVKITDKLPEISGYKFQIEQLFQNIISNSIKYKQANKFAEITISYSKLKSYHKLTIKDNGIGIDKENLKQVFELNYTTEKKSGSSGIGLSICKDIVCAHKGRIIAKSLGKDKGSSFIITLPI